MSQTQPGFQGILQLLLPGQAFGEEGEERLQGAVLASAGGTANQSIN
jgi:hypothetical protein